MKAKIDADVLLTLSREQALVFYDWLARFNDSDHAAFEDQSEERVLFDLEAVLEKALEETLSRDYDKKLAKSRDAIRDPVG